VLLTVNRLHATPLSTTGELLVDGLHQAYTLEPPMLPPPVKPRAVPAGTYDYIVAPSAHFERNVICVEAVPGFEDIELHPGNFPDDTHGCCLVGETIGDNFVGQSQAAFNELLGKVAPVGKIEYVDPLPPPKAMSAR